jgi:hypothetical protein
VIARWFVFGTLTVATGISDQSLAMPARLANKTTRMSPELANISRQCGINRNLTSF